MHWQMSNVQSAQAVLHSNVTHIEFIIKNFLTEIFIQGWTYEKYCFFFDAINE